MSTTASPDRDLRGVPDKRLVNLDESFKASLKTFGVGGAAAAVVVNQKIVYAKGYGVCSAADDSAAPGGSSAPSAGPAGQETLFKGGKVKEVPADADTVFGLGVNGEALVNVLVGNLVDEGVLQYNTPIQSILSNFSHPISYATPITTVADVASHRSGLPSTRTSISASLLSEVPAATFPSALSLIPERECSSFRGISVRSHLNTLILACVASKVTGGTPLEVLVKERVWDKCGGSRSAYCADGGNDISNSAVSNARDIARLLCSLLGGWGPISANGLKEFLAPVGIAGADSSVEGVSNAEEARAFSVAQGGWVSSIYRGRRRIGFGLNGSGNNLEAWIYPDTGLGVVVLANKPSHLPTAISNLTSDLFHEFPGVTGWPERLYQVPAPLPLPGELPSDIGFVTNVPASTVQLPIRPLGAYTGLFISSVSPTLALKLTSDGTSLVVTSTVTGGRVVAPVLLSASQIDAFTFQVRNLRPSLKQFVSHQGLLHFKGSADGKIEGVSVLSVDFSNNLNPTFGPTIYFQKSTGNGPAPPKLPVSSNSSNRPSVAIPAVSASVAVASNASAVAATAAPHSPAVASPGGAAPVLPPRKRGPSQGPVAQASQAHIVIPAPIAGSDANEPITPSTPTASGGVRRPPPPLPPAGLKRDTSSASVTSASSGVTVQPASQAQGQPVPVQPITTYAAIPTAASFVPVPSPTSESFVAINAGSVPVPASYAPTLVPVPIPIPEETAVYAIPVSESSGSEPIRASTSSTTSAGGVAVPSATAGQTAGQTAAFAADTSTQQLPPPAYDAYADNNAWACPTPPLARAANNNLNAGAAAGVNRADSFVEAAAAVAASDRDTEAIEEEAESDMNALDAMFDDLGIPKDEGQAEQQNAAAASNGAGVASRRKVAEKTAKFNVEDDDTASTVAAGADAGIVRQQQQQPIQTVSSAITRNSPIPNTSAPVLNAPASQDITTQTQPARATVAAAPTTSSAAPFGTPATFSFVPLPPGERSTQTDDGNVVQTTSGPATPSTSSQNSEGGGGGGVNGKTVGLIIGGVIGGIVLLAAGSYFYTKWQDWNRKGRSLDEIAGDGSGSNSKSLLIPNSTNPRNPTPSPIPSTPSPVDRPPQPMQMRPPLPQQPSPPQQLGYQNYAPPPLAAPVAAVAVQNIPMRKASVDNRPPSPTESVASLTPSMSASMVGVRNQRNAAIAKNLYYPQSSPANLPPANYGNRAYGGGAPRVHGGGMGGRSYGMPPPQQQQQPYVPQQQQPYIQQSQNPYYAKPPPQAQQPLPTPGQVSYTQLKPQQQYAERFSSDLAYNGTNRSR
ncbi:hypothetical protein HDU97_000431 [Phlyctochytrium planicorne]|nr:hypothetical protein HDU97_000431 [Phlyctochytrium planicorne]